MLITLLKSVPNDFKCFNKKEILLLITFALISLLFSIIDFNYFINSKTYPYILKWHNDQHNNVPLWKRVIMVINGISSFTGVLSVVLVTKGKISSHFWGIINSLFYGIFTFAYGYIGSAQSNILIFIPMKVYAIYHWNKNMDETRTIIVSKNRSFVWYFNLTISTIIFGLFMFYEIPYFSKLIIGEYYFATNVKAHVLDTVVNTLSITAHFLLIVGQKENWLLWIITNCISIIMYSGLIGVGFDFNILFMWTLFLINSIVGFILWIKRSIS